MREKSTEINTQEPEKGTKENPGRKRKPQAAENILRSSENIEKRAAINGASRVSADHKIYSSC